MNTIDGVILRELGHRNPNRRWGFWRRLRAAIERVRDEIAWWVIR